jgi:DnaK suppressor protein
MAMPRETGLKPRSATSRTRARAAGSIRNGQHGRDTTVREPQPRHGHTVGQYARPDAREYRRLLDTERRRILGELESMNQRAAEMLDVPRTGAEGGEDDAAADAAIHTLERDRDSAVQSNLRDVLEEIEQALARLRQGTFGTCVRCQRPITAQRLHAIPYAALCIRCKEEQERAYALFGSVPCREWRVFKRPKDWEEEEAPMPEKRPTRIR